MNARSTQAALRLVHDGIPLRPTAERRQIIKYPSGHTWRANREHIDRVLDVKAAMAMDGGMR